MEGRGKLEMRIRFCRKWRISVHRCMHNVELSLVSALLREQEKGPSRKGYDRQLEWI